MISDPNFKMHKAKLNSQLLYANIFSSINLVGQYLYVSHEKMVSKYDLLKKTWIAHKKFSSVVL